MKIKKIVGFTLAEVLITLGVIGVVAAISIPILINEYQKSVYLNGLKNAYAEINTGIRNYMADKDCTDVACTGLFEGQAYADQSWADRMNEEMPKIFKSVTIIDPSDPEFVNLPNYALSGKDAFTGMFSGVGTFQLQNGILFIMADGDSGNCTYFDSFPASI